MAEIAAELGVNAQSLRNWVAQARIDAGGDRGGALGDVRAPEAIEDFLRTAKTLTTVATHLGGWAANAAGFMGGRGICGWSCFRRHACAER